MPSTADVIVIGGGHNGLVCAAYLARAGRKVLGFQDMWVRVKKGGPDLPNAGSPQGPPFGQRPKRPPVTAADEIDILPAETQAPSGAVATLAELDPAYLDPDGPAGPGPEAVPVAAGDLPASLGVEQEPDGQVARPVFQLDVLGGPALAVEPVLEAVREAAPGLAIIASGGIGSLDDIRRLASAGFHAAIIGRGLYAGAFTLPEALEAAIFTDRDRMSDPASG